MGNFTALGTPTSGPLIAQPLPLKWAAYASSEQAGEDPDVDGFGRALPAAVKTHGYPAAAAPAGTNHVMTVLLFGNRPRIIPRSVLLEGRFLANS
jgi:hypothetical protein